MQKEIQNDSPKQSDYFFPILWDTSSDIYQRRMGISNLIVIVICIIVVLWRQ